MLEGCSDKEVAFMNWMNRDILFAKQIQLQCDEYNFFSFINDGTISLEDMVALVKKHMKL